MKKIRKTEFLIEKLNNKETEAEEVKKKTEEFFKIVKNYKKDCSSHQHYCFPSTIEKSLQDYDENT